MARLGIRLDGGASCVLPGEEGASPHRFGLFRTSQARQHCCPQFTDEETEAERFFGLQVSPTRPGSCSCPGLALGSRAGGQTTGSRVSEKVSGSGQRTWGRGGGVGGVLVREALGGGQGESELEGDTEGGPRREEQVGKARTHNENTRWERRPGTEVGQTRAVMQPAVWSSVGGLRRDLSPGSSACSPRLLLPAHPCPSFWFVHDLRPILKVTSSGEPPCVEPSGALAMHTCPSVSTLPTRHPTVCPAPPHRGLAQRRAFRSRRDWRADWALKAWGGSREGGQHLEASRVPGERNGQGASYTLTGRQRARRSHP